MIAHVTERCTEGLLDEEVGLLIRQVPLLLGEERVGGVRTPRTVLWAGRADHFGLDPTVGAG